MGKAQEKQTLKTETSPIIMEHDQQVDDYEEEAGNGGCGCGCFHLFWFDNHRSSEADDSIKLLYQTGTHKETWLMKKLKELKEFSELVAGPKWKNFIRKFSTKKHKKNTHQFQYDPQSYALNFNDGGGEEEDDSFLARNFSTRFAPPLADQQRRPTTL